MSPSDQSSAAVEAAFLEISMSLGVSADGDRIAQAKLRRLIGFLVPDRMPLVFQIMTSVNQTHPEMAQDLGGLVSGLLADRLIAAGVYDGRLGEGTANARALPEADVGVLAPEKAVPNLSRKKDFALKREIAVFETLLGPNARPVSADELFKAAHAADGTATRNQILTLLSKLSREAWIERRGGAYRSVLPNSRVYLDALLNAADMRRDAE